MSSLQLPPLSLYLHIPWCVRKCPYCDFNSHKASPELPENNYVEAVIADLLESLDLLQGRRLESIFIGGGTPSLFRPKAIDQLLTAAEKHIGFSDNIEITMEANPGTFEQDKFVGFRQAGVNRLSIGIQSFSDLHLQQLGRIHGGDEARKAVAMARTAGFDNLNLDLMHGLPQQTPIDAEQDLKIAVELGSEHLSWYQLTIEPNTEFYSRPPTLPVDDLLADIQDRGEALLSDAGFQQYEVSAYARKGLRARHNLNYWQYGDYLGLGAGAHGKITQPEKGQIVRLNKTRLPEHYMDTERSFTAAERVVEADDRGLEFMMNALRLVDGVTRETFEQRSGLLWPDVAATVAELQARKLLTSKDGVIATTRLGQRYLNEVLAAFM
ncbi:MAG: YggW family oxidoreductase [Cellvibrionaceae bacterium]|nr:YggW family oxidoreductase [Cellvibrionaceae bacterium]|tara:strand:+ start:24698 stop:25843 length:1146 start_codon:yes stop_codon:yes gene_type:complete